MKLIKNDAGLQMVKEICTNMKIDKEWLINSESGFEWWGNHFKQKIWADPPMDVNSTSITRVHVETDFLEYPKRSESTDTQLATILRLSSLSGIIHDPKEGCLKWHSSAFVHKESENWIEKMLSLAAILQLRDAEIIGALAKKFELKPHHSCHPHSGLREKMDGLLCALNQWIIPEGQKPVDDIGEAEFSFVSAILKRANIRVSASDNGLSAYVPFGRDVSLLQVNTNQPHPVLGNGILMRLSLSPEDLWEIEELNGSLIIDMNSRDNKEWPTGHFFGSWCLGPAGTNSFTPAFVSFIPIVACNRTVFVNMVLSMLGHNTWAEGYFFAWDRKEKFKKC
jgi:hypothetical protein